MATDLILKAASIITMEEDLPRAEAVAIDTSTGDITAVGSLADVQASAPGVSVTDLGTDVLMPGFIDPHNHPALSGLATQEPAHWIAPYVGYPTYADVQALWKKLRPSPEDNHIKVIHRHHPVCRQCWSGCLVGPGLSKVGLSTIAG